MEAIRLSTRDLSILTALGSYRELDRLQIQGRFFPLRDPYTSQQAANRRLKRLLDAGLVKRERQLLVKGDGDRPAIYSLTVEGAHRIGQTKRSRETQLGGFVLEHRRLSNSLLLRLEAAATERGWVVKVDGEPSLRAELRGTGLPIPDGRIYVETSRATYCALLECDTGTEWVKGKLKRKFEGYLEHRRKLLKAHGQDKVRVLVVTRARLSPLQFTTDPADNDKRVQDVLSMLRGLSTDSEMIALTSFDAFDSHDPLTDPIWYVATQTRPTTLF